MKILVLGGNGMLGHKLVGRFGQTADVFATVRNDSSVLSATGICPPNRIIEGLDVCDHDRIEQTIEEIAPDFILNAIGVTKHRRESENPALSIGINALLPHRLANAAHKSGARLITFSTDCVFKGDIGGYTEEDEPDAVDIYGKTKELGETISEHCLTIRSSIIGRELNGNNSLVEWAISKRGETIGGYTNALYSGFTTLEMARIVEMIINERPGLSGLYHISSEPIDKFHLLELVNKYFDLGINIEKDDSFVIDRTLNSDRFRSETGFVPKSWDLMISEMAEDAVEYEKWRKLQF